MTSQVGLGLSFSNPVGLDVDEEFRALILEEEEGYESIYRLGLRKSIYNFVLIDYAYFQFSYRGDRMRYAFYPNPFATATPMSDLLEQMEKGLISFEELAELISDEPSRIGVPPVRYEFAPGQYKEIEHPCAHFHIGHHGENRWPIARQLTPVAFTMWILKMYYPSRWRQLADDEHEYGNILDREMARERGNCGQLGQEHFSERERRLFHFT